MPFHATREATGVTVITVEGQLIVANRQELKEMIGTALERCDLLFSDISLGSGMSGVQLAAAAAS